MPEMSQEATTDTAPGRIWTDAELQEFEQRAVALQAKMRRGEVRVGGPNSPYELCGCGSGRKWKFCHGRKR